MSVLTAVDLHKHFGERHVVCGISLNIKQGEIVGLLGPNGAGKTTTFYMMLGIIQPTAGEVFLNDERISDWPLYERARLGLSYLPQESSVFKKLSVWDNLLLILQYTDRSATEAEARAQELMDDFGISHLRNSLAMHLSGGERRRLEIARSLIREPQFVLLDEPFAGIDPLAVDDIQGLIIQLKERNIGIIISDHNVRETLNLCDRAYIVYEGRAILNGTPEEIAVNPQARRV
jgi:lipopolysaccharide export system ATP-binding protein